MTSVPPEHPNLQLALGRLRRTTWLWAVLFAALGGLSLASSRLAEPVLPLIWLVIAVLLVSRPEPAYLALVAVAWGFSLVFLIPGVRDALGSDPILRLFAVGTIETVALSVVRVLLLVTAWNQFQFFRLLYGTQGAAGLDAALPDIPEVVPNRAARLSIWARLAGFLGVMAALASVPLPAEPGIALRGAAYGAAVFAVGLGLGSAFVPNPRRGMALWAVGLGSAALLAAMLVGRALGAGSG